MKFIESAVKEIKQEPGLEGIYKQIAYGGRICYMSEKVGKEEDFLNMLKSRNHLSPTEHGAVYLMISMDDHNTLRSMLRFYSLNPYSKTNLRKGDLYVSTNYRVIIENHRESDLQYLCEPTEFHDKRRTFHVICSEGIAREFNRHRTLSPSQASTRYCNYSKDKFGNELTFIKPYWVSCNEPEGADQITRIWFNSCYGAEQHYMRLIQNGYKPQEAREVLPLCTKTEVVYSAFESDWNHFLELRCDSHAHPDAQKLANMIKELL